MKNRWKAVLAAFVAASVVMLVGVVAFFKPIAQADSVSGAPVPAVVAFLVYMVLIVALFDWAARQLRNAYKAAFLIGFSQFLLVNVDFVLTGKRGLMTAGASTVLMVVFWTCVAFVYSYFTASEKPGKEHGG